MEPAVRLQTDITASLDDASATEPFDKPVDSAAEHPHVGRDEGTGSSSDDSTPTEMRSSITKAISTGHLSMLADAMRSGARADFTVEGDQEHSPVLLFALRKGNLDAAKTLLFGKLDGDVGDALRCNLDTADARGITPLMYACSSGQYDFARLLLDVGANITLKDAEGLNALFHTFLNRKSEDSLTFFKHIVTRAALLRVPDPDDDPPVEKLLLDHAERNRRMTVLMLASAAGAYPYAAFLVGKGANVHARDGNGESAPFHSLNSQEHYEKLLELFYTPDGYLRLYQKDRKGTERLLPMMDVEEELRPAKWPVMHIKYALNDNYQSLLAYAVRNRKVEQSRLLLDRYQLDPDFHDRDGRTPLVYAAQNANEHGLMLVRMLLQPDTYREKVVAKDEDGTVVLEKDGTPKMVDEVKTRWKIADTKKRDFFGVTALQVALENQNIACARELLGGGAEGGPTAGIDPAMQDILRTIVYPGGKTPLMNCVGREGALGLTKELLNARVDVNAKDVNGRTALMYVALRGDLEDQNYEESRTTRALVNASVKVYDRDCDGRSALHFAAYHIVKRQEFKGSEFLTTRIDIIKELVTTARDMPGVLDDFDRPPLTYAIFCRATRNRSNGPDLAAMAAAITEARRAGKGEEASLRTLPHVDPSLEAIGTELSVRHAVEEPTSRPPFARRGSSISRAVPDRVLLARAGFDVEGLPADFDVAKAARAVEEERSRERWMMERGIALLLHLDLTRVKRADGSVDMRADVRSSLQWTVDFRDAVGLSPLMWAAFTDFPDPAVYGRECLDLLLLCSKNSDMKRFLDSPSEHEIELNDEKQPTFRPGEPEFLGLIEYFANFDPVVNYKKIVRVCRLPVHCALLFSRAFRERASNDEVRKAEFNELADQAAELAFELLDEKYQEADFHNKLLEFFEAPHIVSLEHKRVLAERRAAAATNIGAAQPEAGALPGSAREGEQIQLLQQSPTSSGRSGALAPKVVGVRMPPPRRESLIDIAQSIGSRAGKWMAHPATKAYLRLKWAGEMAPGESNLGFVFLRPFDGIFNQRAYYSEERYNVFEPSVPNRPASFFATARGKFAMEFLFYVAFIVFYSLAINNQTIAFNLYDLLLGIMVAGFVAAEGGQLIEERLEYFKSPWNLSDVTMMGMFLAYYLLRTYAQIHPGWSSADWNVTAYRVLAPNAILLWTRLLNTCDLHPDLGPLLVIIKGMMTDFFVFIIVLALVLLGFAQTIHVFMEPILSPDNSLALTDSIIMMFRAVLGGDFYEQVQEAFPAWGPLFYFAFVILSTVMLLNLLIALFGGTYARITDNAQNEFQFGRATTYLSFVQRAYVPPPFNLIAKAFSIAGALPVFCFGRSCRATGCERLGNRVASITFLICLAPFALVLFLPVTLYERLAAAKSRALEDEEVVGAGAREGGQAGAEAEEDDFTVQLYEGEGEEEGEEGWQQVHRLNRTMQREVRNSLGLIEARLTGLERRVEASKEPQKAHARPILAAPRIASDGTLLGPLEPPEPPPPLPTEHEIVLGELNKLQGNLDAFVASLSQRSGEELEDVKRQVQRASQMDAILDRKLAALTEAVTGMLARGEHHADSSLAAARAAIERRVEDRVAGVEAAVSQQGAELAQATTALGVKLNGLDLRLQQRLQEVTTSLENRLHDRTRNLEGTLTRHLSAILASLTGSASLVTDIGLTSSAEQMDIRLASSPAPTVATTALSAPMSMASKPGVQAVVGSASKAPVEEARGTASRRRKGETPAPGPTPAASAPISAATAASLTAVAEAAPVASENATARSRLVPSGMTGGATLEERLSAQIAAVAAHVASVEEETSAHVSETRRVLEERLTSLAATLTGGSEEEQAADAAAAAAAGGAGGGAAMAASVLGKWRAAVGTSTLEDRLAKKILTVASTVAKAEEQGRASLAETLRTIEERLSDLAAVIAGTPAEIETGQEVHSLLLKMRAAADTAGSLEERLTKQILAVAQSVIKSEEEMKQQVTETTRTIEKRLADLAATLTGTLSETKTETEKRISQSSSGMEQKTSQLEAKMSAATSGLQENLAAATSGLESKVAAATSTLEQRLSQAIAAVASSVQEATMSLNAAVSRLDTDSQRRLADATKSLEQRISAQLDGVTASLAKGEAAAGARTVAVQEALSREVRAVQEALADHSRAVAEASARGAAATDARIATVQEGLSVQLAGVAGQLAQHAQAVAASLARGDAESAGMVEQLAGLASMVREQAVHLDFLRDRVEQIAKLQSTLDDYWVTRPSGASQRMGAPGSHVSPQTITALMSSISTSLADVKAQIALKRASSGSVPAMPPSSP